MRLIVKSPVWDDLREIGLRIADRGRQPGGGGSVLQSSRAGV